MNVSNERAMSAESTPLPVGAGEQGHLAFVAPPRGLYVQVVKPIFDRVVGSILLVLCSPLFALVAVAVRLRIGHPVLFRQPRCGLDGRPFDVSSSARCARTAGNGPQSVPEDRRVTHKSERTHATPVSVGGCASGASTSSPSSGTSSGAR